MFAYGKIPYRIQKFKPYYQAGQFTPEFMKIQTKFPLQKIVHEGQFAPNNLKTYFQNIEKQREIDLQLQRREVLYFNQFLWLGRSNVGKSSLINSIFQQKVCEVSNVPGKTRNLSFYKINNTILVDAPGYGFAVGDKKELQAWGKMLQNYFTQSFYLHRVMLLIDSSHLIKQVDLMLMQMLESQKKPFVIILTKCEKQKDIMQVYQEIENKVLGKFNMASQIIHATSSKENQGIKELQNNILYMMNMDLIQRFQDNKM